MHQTAERRRASRQIDGPTTAPNSKSNKPPHAAQESERKTRSRKRDRLEDENAALPDGALIASQT